MAEHLDYVSQTDATDIIVIYNQYSQYDYVKKHVKDFLEPQIVHIHPNKNLQLSRFENNSETLKKAAKQMGKKTKALFGLKSGITLFESI